MVPKPLHILVSPLDWGLGHASRCIPLIRQLVDVGHRVTLAGRGRSLVLLQKEFPSLEIIETDGFSPSYSRSGNMVLHLFMLLPKFITSIYQDHRFLKKYIYRYNFDVVISDNRYGLWNNNIRSILITHQVMIKAPYWLRFAEYPLYLASRMLISRFDECWIPDAAESPGLSGDLSHKYPLPANAKFIGPLSRFQQSEQRTKNQSESQKIVVIISGPEPQRSLFEELILKQLAGSNYAVTIISGKPEIENAPVSENNITILPHLAAKELSSLITSSLLVICRSGYTSVMDLHALGAKALFVPTPGQTEQIYLAELLQNKGVALWRTQKELNLNADIEKAFQFSGFNTSIALTLLKEAITDLKKK